MRAAKVQASLRIRAVSPEPSLLAHTSSESRGTLRQRARSMAPLNGWACAVEICHDGMLEDTNSLHGAQFINSVVLPYRNASKRCRWIGKQCRSYSEWRSGPIIDQVPFCLPRPVWSNTRIVKMSHVMRKTLFLPYMNNKGTEQPAHRSAQSDQRLCCSLPR